MTARPGESPDPAGTSLVVLSPHLDDAVLSAGGQIARWVALGRPVEVWTAFTAGPPAAGLPRRLRRFARYDLRLSEDDAALDLLGAGRERLGLRERIWSEAAGGSLVAAFRTPATLDGFANLGALSAAVGRALDRPGTRLLAPLGIGHHADHVEVAVAALTTALDRDALDRVGFYEDYYALSETARRRHPVTRRRRLPWRAAPGLAAPAAGLVLGLTPLIGAGPGLEAYLPLSGLVWDCRPESVTGHEDLKLSAIARYRSQTPALGGMWQLAAILRRAHRLRGGELIWRARPR